MKGFIALLLISLYLQSITEPVYYDRNELPQLNEQIIEESDFLWEHQIVLLDDLQPVQTQRVRGLTEKELVQIRDNTYRPLIIDKNNRIIDGHHRYDAAKSLNIKEIRVIRISANIRDVVEAFQEHRDFTPVINP